VAQDINLAWLIRQMGLKGFEFCVTRRQPTTGTAKATFPAPHPH